MKLQFKTVSVTISGDYYQIMFHDDLDSDDEPYFMIQRQFEFPDGGVCHFESHYEDLSEHCKVKLATLSNNMLRLSYGEKVPRDIEITFGLGCADLQSLTSALKEMIPEVMIDAY